MPVSLPASGLPISLDPAMFLLSFDPTVLRDSYARKVTSQMAGLLRDMRGARPDEPYYDVYRDVRFAGDEPLFARDHYRYDLTLIMPGQVNGECKKTSGHYHGYNPARSATYAEVYEVIYGTAIYVLQRADNFDGDPVALKIDDLVVVKVEAGQTILVPPNYGHCSVNAGEGPLLFSNLCYVPCPLEYEPIRRRGGLACHIMRENGRIRCVQNPGYAGVAMPKPRFASVGENSRLGVTFGRPIYHSYRDNPAAFHFLGNPDGYADEILAMLKTEDAEWLSR